MTSGVEVTRDLLIRGDTQIEVLVQGEGLPVVLLPSLGRGASDFDEIAGQLASAGFRVLRPEPRGIGRSRGPHCIDLHDCAADIAAVIAHEDRGPAFVVGHAFGNRVARMLATDRPELVTAVGLIAANVGHAPSPPLVRAAIKASADVSLPVAERLKGLRYTFFAPGNDVPQSWLDGWFPDVLAVQRVAGDRTARTEDYAGGAAPILYLQPDSDPLGHVEDAHEFQRALGDRVTIVVIRNASHAVIAEQPAAVSEALIAYARRNFSASMT